MPGKTHGERLDRLEQIVEILAERHGDLEKLEKIVADLATETRRAFDQVAARFRETDEQIRQTNEQLRQTNEQSRQRDDQLREQMHESNAQLNERVDKLVSAIGEFIRTQHPPR